LRLLLLGVGRLKASLERDLAARYIDRAAAAGRSLGFSALDVRELDESRASSAESRKVEEAKAMRAQLPKQGKLILFDERGAALTSPDFANLIGALRDGGTPQCTFIIGGADGLAPELASEAYRQVSFGAMTWPHQLVRVLAAEQLYRAMTILSGHPYHRV